MSLFQTASPDFFGELLLSIMLAVIVTVPLWGDRPDKDSRNGD